MALYKEKDGAGFEQVPNDLIRTASIKATGMWCFIAQLPDGWNFSVQGLAKVMKEGKDAIRSAIQELEELGYLVRRQTKDKEGKFCNSDWELRYHSYKPSEKTPSWENTSSDCPPQYKYLNNKDLKKQIPKDIKEIYKESSNLPKKRQKDYSDVILVGERLMTKWNEKFSDSLTVKPIMRLTERRVKGIKARLEDGYTLEDLEKAIDMASTSQWCTSGRWGFGFDWIYCYKDNILKLLEGTYNNKTGNDVANDIVAATYSDPAFAELYGKENKTPQQSNTNTINRNNITKLEEMKRKTLGEKYD